MGDNERDESTSPELRMTEHTDGWAAPIANEPVTGRIRIPGSKSWTNRALILAAQADGPSRIPQALRSRDTLLMAQALTSLGVAVDTAGDTWTVRPGPIGGERTVDCGLAGTVMRFLPPLAATGRGEITFDGDPAARVRPMTTILTALRGLGAEIDGDSLPFVLHAKGLAGGTVTIDASASSQFVSGLLLAGASTDQGIQVVHEGKPVPSLPHIEMTIAALRSVGVEVEDSRINSWQVRPGTVRPWTMTIEPDLSNATPFLAAAAVTAGTVTIPDWPAQTSQAGDAFREIAERFGCTVRLADGELTVTGPEQLAGVDLDLHEVGELTPTVLALSLFADSPSVLRGIGHLRGHETDRLEALSTDANALGGTVSVLDEGALRIVPGPLHGGLWRSYADHRMATAGAIVGLRVPGVQVDDIGCTAKTLPDFPELWAGLLAGA